MRDEKRLDVIQRVYRSELTVGQAALVLGLSERQCYRVKARVSKVGVKGVVHGNRGRPCKRKLKEKTVKRVLELARGKYQGFNDHHLTEKLKEQESIELSREQVRRILRAEGIASPKKRRGIKHRSRRERRPAEGMMLQVDGSPHDWLEGRGPPMCLIGAIDDATSKVTGGFFTQAESSWGYFTLFSDTFGEHGLPHSIYTDCHSVFWTDRQPTVQEQLLNKKPTTEVGRGLEELGVSLILAHSPQAKGRIERLWNTFQDRLVSELRLANAKTLEQAQAVLERYIPEHNRRFAKPANAEPAWRKVSSLQIQRALCFKQQRTVAKDNTITFEGTVLQIPKTSPFRSYANKRVEVHVLLDGAVEVFYKTEKIAAFDSKTTHTLGLYPTRGKKEGFRYGPISMHTNLPHKPT
ncbi:MAG TPA: ISNCY family transposase [Pyrinomonadaceae bacterium]